MSDSRDTTVLGVDPGATTPWGDADREWGGDVNVDLYSVFAPETYCPVGRFDQAPRPVRLAFRGTTDLMAWWLDPGSQHLDPEALMEQESSGRVRKLAERFLASTEGQRDQYAAAVLAAARQCDTDALRAAADVLAAAPATSPATSPAP